MNFTEIKKRMLNDLEWITSLTDEQQAELLDRLMAEAGTYDEWEFIHWCEWPKAVEGVPTKRSQALMEMARLATTDVQIKEVWEECQADLRMKDNTCWLTNVDEAKTLETESYVADVICYKYKTPLALSKFIYGASKAIREKLQKVVAQMNASRKEWVETWVRYEYSNLPSKVVLDKIFDRITFGEVIDAATIWANKGGSVSSWSNREEFYQNNFLPRVNCWLHENATFEQVLDFGEKMPDTFRGRFLLELTQTIQKEQEKENALTC
jgi:hypothetical protein